MKVSVRRFVLPTAVAVGMGAVALAAAGGGFSGAPAPPPSDPSELEQPPPSTPSPVEPVAPPQGAADIPDDPLLLAILVWIVLVGFLLFTLLLVVYLIYLGLRFLLAERVVRRPLATQAPSQPSDPGPEADEVRRAVRAGLESLDAGGDARRAVIACWLALERIAVTVGTARLVADTPADLVARLLARHHVNAAALDRLAGAYRRARYAPARVDAALAAEAAEALREIDRQLTLFARPVAPAPLAGTAGPAPRCPLEGGRG